MTDVSTNLTKVLFPVGSQRRALILLISKPKYWFGLIGLGVLLVLRLFSDIKVGMIDSKRIGHFVMDVGIRFAEESLDDFGAKTIYWTEGHISNSFWFELMKRNLTCNPVALPISHLARFFKKSNEWFVPSPHWTSASRDIEGVVSRSEAAPEFLHSENLAAREWLRSVGWRDGQKIVCVLVRDSEFLNSETALTPPDLGNRGFGSWDYHDYRDSDIDSFVPAMEWLADQNALILRMGKVMSKPLTSRHAGVIDYAFHPDRSDFLDVWLFANCDLCVTTGSGPDAISVLYRRPVLCVNYLPISRAFTSGPVMTAGKRLYDNSGKRLSLREHFDTNFSITQDYDDAGITIRNLESGEILEIVKEMWRALVHTPTFSAKDKVLKAEFIHLLAGSTDSDDHGWIHPDAKLSRVWVENLLSETQYD